MTKEKNENKENTAAEDGLVEFTVNGVTMFTTVTRKYTIRKKWSKPDEKKVISFIPGTIREIFVSEGDSVSENSRLMVLEAMKMMNVITSPLAGTIKKINVKAGDKVAKGIVMVELED